MRWFWNAPGLAAAVVAMLLVACGGGADRGGIEAQQGTKTSRARVLALAPVVPEEAARQLMDFAEVRYPQYFPSRQPTQSLPPFAYRHYPDTGVYLGVVVTAGMGYEPMGVYVMGGTFGSSPQFVGPLASFITPAVEDPGPVAASNGCFDEMLAFWDQPGNRLIEVSRVSGSSMYERTTDSTVVGPATFEGQAVMRIRRTDVQGSYPSGVPDGLALATTTDHFEKRTGPAEYTRYGGESSMSSSTAVPGGGSIDSHSESRLVYAPPLVIREAALAPGQSLTLRHRSRSTVVSTVTTVGTPVPLPPQTTTNSSESDFFETITFLRREPITVPLGKFNACVFQSTFPNEPGHSYTTWVADGRGVGLKTVWMENGVQTAVDEAVSIRINGQLVTN
ncbi:MAG: hypothetical protein IT500_08460 [Rubrivivax sp.]|nr:hypothetical protein [Rubrivivax sp.]